MMNRYMIRPHDAFFEQFCYALFIKRYQLQTKLIENDSQPEELVDELVETNHSTSSSYPKLLIQKAMHITYFICFTRFVMSVS